MIVSRVTLIGESSTVGQKMAGKGGITTGNGGVVVDNGSHDRGQGWAQTKGLHKEMLSRQSASLKEACSR